MTLDMTWLAWGVVILAALVIGVLVQLYLQPKTSYEWLVTGVGAVLGAWLGSEITAFATTGPVWENLAIIPAVIGGVIGAAVFEFAARAIEPAPTPA
jgi:uncharacterized membrane protein YeaQ/YmgE (transglycosylase-associated protein family)